MSWSLKKKLVITPADYDAILDEVRYWFANELTNLPPQQVDGKQTNALLNFATFDLHALETKQGFDHMMLLLTGRGTDQTVMIRLKGLVVDLYIKFGEELIDALRMMIYKTLSDMYGLTFNIDRDLDVNNTFWLHPLITRCYHELKLQK